MTVLDSKLSDPNQCAVGCRMCRGVHAALSSNIQMVFVAHTSVPKWSNVGNYAVLGGVWPLSCSHSSGCGLLLLLLGCAQWMSWFGLEGTNAHVTSMFLQDTISRNMPAQHEEQQQPEASVSMPQPLTLHACRSRQARTIDHVHLRPD